MRYLNKRTLPLLTLTLLAAGWALVFAQSVFRFDGPLSRVVTPNGDSLNDVGIICFDNFADSDVEGKVFTLLGAQVGVLRKVNSQGGCAGGQKMQQMHFDPRAMGLRNGIYVYQVKADGKSFSGTFIVTR